MPNKDANEVHFSRLTAGIIFAKYLGNVYVPVLQFFGFRKRTYLPPIEDDLLSIPAVDLAEAIRKQRITSVKVVEAYINRIKAVDPILTAVIENRFEVALEEAQEADLLCKTLPEEQLKQKYPLMGVPFTVKESVGLKGMACHMGDVKRKHFKSVEDGSSIKYLRAAGAIPLAVTNIPEWALAWETYNYTTGRTLNPYNTKYCPGGSSGGEGALIGAAASLFGMGTDFMGSIRIPAMFNGIYGHRPTRPMISNAGATPCLLDKEIQNVFCVGPMCRYAKDLPILMKIAAGPNADSLNLDEPVDLKKLTIYYSTSYCQDFSAVKVKPEIINSISKATAALNNAGAELKSIDIFEKNWFGPLFCKFMEFDYTDFIEMSSIPYTKWSLCKEYFKWGLGMSDHNINAIYAHNTVRYFKGTVSKNDRKKYQAQANELKNKLKELLGQDSVLLIPTFPTPAYKHYGSFRRFPGMAYIMLASAFNFPATSVPMGLNAKGLPIGIQVIANENQDRLCLAVAQQLEKDFGGWVPPILKC